MGKRRGTASRCARWGRLGHRWSRTRALRSPLPGVAWQGRREHEGRVLEYALAPPSTGDTAYTAVLRATLGSFHESFTWRIEVRGASGRSLALVPDRIAFDPTPRGQLTLFFE
ncbi:MAG: hypothetical protein GY711_28295 [bacterium]|nr:hypothetical protein [bacterium]